MHCPWPIHKLEVEDWALGIGLWNLEPEGEEPSRFPSFFSPLPASAFQFLIPERKPSTSVVLPIPASPVTKTIWRSPCRALANSLCSRASSGSRPTKAGIRDWGLGI